MTTSLPAPATRQELAVLRHADRRSAWAIVVSARFDRPLGPLDDAIAALQRAVPIVGARLHGETWYPGAPPAVITDAGAEVTGRFNLRDEPPLRVLATGDRLTVIGHHAAFDGRSLLAIVTALAGGPLPAPSAPEPKPVSGARTGASMLERLRHPADPVAATNDREVFVARPAVLAGRSVTARLAAVAAVAAGEHNAARSAPWRRIGITLTMAGRPGVGNTATYRRVLVSPGDDVEAAAAAALASPDEPAELVRAPRLLMAASRLVAGRLSDSFLVSNIGPADVPGAVSLEFYPVARGRSAVAIGAAGITGGGATVTLRSMHLARADAERLLDRIVELMAPSEAE